MSKPLFALIDCSNFFVACERLFRPDLAKKPVVVLSSNDGCVIARSDEAKALGIPMAAPAFKYKQLFKNNGVVQFSANFELYGDLSRRIAEILTSITPRLEVYSIDESFLDVGQLPIKDYAAWGREVRRRINMWVGIPVRIGIAPSKTLAKLASDYVKQVPKLESVLELKEPVPVQYLQGVSIEEVWGVGWRLSPKLRAHGITTAWDLAQLSPAQGRAYFGSVAGERLVRELQGQSCSGLEPIKQVQKMVSATCTFGEDTNQAYVVEAALANFVARSAARLRTQKLVAGRLSIFLTTDRHKTHYRKWFKQKTLDQPTADTGLLAQQAAQLFKSIYDSRALYHRGGITLSSLQEENILQINLLSTMKPEAFDRARARMRSVDQLNARFGASTLRYAAEDLARSWQPRRSIRSPRYTTNWEDLPKIKIKPW